MSNKAQFGMFFFFVFLLVGTIIFFGCWYIISPGERGVLLTLGKASDDVKLSGFHWKMPLIQSIIKYEVRTLKYEPDSESEAASKDLQIVKTRLAVNYHLNPEAVVSIYKELGLDYNFRVIQPAIQEVVKASTAQYTAEELITKRAEVKDVIKQGLHDRLINRNIVVEDISIINFDFSESFNQAIEAKVTMEQNALAAKNKLEQIKFEAEQRISQAKGESEAIKIQAEAIQARGGQAYIQLQAINKWNGVMPTVIAGGVVPFINIPFGGNESV